MRVATAVLCLAACGGTGVDVEIHSEVAVDRVEIFVGDNYCYETDGSSCDGGVAYVTNQRRPSGETFVMTENPARILPEPDGDAWVIHLDAASGANDPPIIGFVGFATNNGIDQPVAVAWIEGSTHIPSNSSLHWDVTLEAAGPAMLATTGAPGSDEPTNRVAVWKREGVDDPDGVMPCIALQNWDGDAREWVGHYIVPDEDRDCDGVPADLECDDRAAHANTNGGAQCLAPLPPPAFDAVDACQLGTTPCQDGVSSDHTCATNAAGPQICVPDRLCETCDDPLAVEDCAAYNARHDDEVPRIECTFDGDASTGAICAEQDVGSHASFELPFPCHGGTELRALASPFSPVTGTFTFNGISVVTDNSTLDPTCTVNVYWVGGTASGTGTVAWLAVRPAADLPMTLTIPIKLSFNDDIDCASTTPGPSMCTVDDPIVNLTDHIVACAGVMPVE